MTNAIAVIDAPNGALVASNDQTVELAKEIMTFHPSYGQLHRQLGEAQAKNAMMTVAQIALMTGASPIPSTNEIHCWVQGKQLTISLGLNYFRRKAREKARGIFFKVKPRPMTASEMEEYGVDADKELGAICEGCRIDQMSELVKAGMPSMAALDGLSQVGTATVKKSEYAKNGRSRSWTAIKRAEIDLIRSLVPDHASDATPTASVQGNRENVILREDNGIVFEHELRKGSGKDLGDPSKANMDLFGFDNEVETEEAQEDIQDGDFEDAAEESAESTPQEAVEPIETIDTETGEIITQTKPESNWLESALSAKTIDQFAMAAYQVEEVKIGFKDAVAVKGFVNFIVKGLDDADTQAQFEQADKGKLIAAARRFVSSTIDGAKRSEAARAAKNWFERPPEPETP